MEQFDLTNIDNLKLLLSIAAAIFSFSFAIGAAIVTFYFRIIKSMEKSINKLEMSEVTTEALLKEFTKQLGKVALTNEKLAIAVATMSTKLDEREKDILKIEGAVSVTQKNLIDTIGTIKETSGSLSAMWRTLQRLFPDQVPARASDY
jgi:hypothetical protein